MLTGVSDAEHNFNVSRSFVNGAEWTLLFYLDMINSKISGVICDYEVVVSVVCSN